MRAYRVLFVCCHVGCEGGILGMGKFDYGRRKKLTDGEKIWHYGREKKSQQLTGKGDGRGVGEVQGMCRGCVGGVSGCVWSCCRVVVSVPYSLSLSTLIAFLCIRSYVA